MPTPKVTSRSEHVYQGKGKAMASPVLHPDLERRVAELEKEANQGAGFTAADWFWLIALGIAGPAAMLVWGWTP